MPFSTSIDYLRSYHSNCSSSDFKGTVIHVNDFKVFVCLSVCPHVVNGILSRIRREILLYKKIHLPDSY